MCCGYDIIRNQVEKEERKVLAAAGCNITERVFTAEEVHSPPFPLPRLSLQPITPSLSLSVDLWEVDNRTKTLPVRSL